MRSYRHMMDREVSIILLGVGHVGSALLQLIADRAKRRQNGTKIRVVGLADSRAALLAPTGFTKKAISDVLEAKQQSGTIAYIRESFPVRELASAFTPKIVVVDATASGDTAPLLRSALERGCGVVLANKRPLATPWAEAEVFFTHPLVRFEATVAAGLPVISTLQNLIACGDSLVSATGVLSGTLGYMCNQMERGVSYSAALMSARVLDYTEPDPRDDLQGTDVARKALILARTAGWPLELADLTVEPLFPDSLSKLSVDEFLRAIPAFDADYARRVRRAQETGRLLRYTAQINATGGTVGLTNAKREGPVGILHGPGNTIVFHSQFYDEMPIVISGPGAGPQVTAAGVLGDILHLALCISDHEERS